MARRYHGKAVIENPAESGLLPNVNQAMIRGACPLCSILREFQTIAIERVDASSSGPFCNFHCWSIANSAPAMIAVSVYSNLLQRQELDETLNCCICAAIQAQEQVRIREFIADLERLHFAEWMRKFGTLCSIHAAKLEHSVPAELRKTIQTIFVRSKEEIEEQLREYAENIKAGDHSGGGVLGKTAAFLVGFRGFTY